MQWDTTRDFLIGDISDSSYMVFNWTDSNIYLLFLIYCINVVWFYIN